MTTGPAERPIRQFFRTWGVRAVQFGTAIVILFAFQHLMLRLSGGALWLPSEWRNAIQILGLGVATLVFELSRPPAPKPGPEGSAGAPLGEPMRPWQFTIACLGIALVGLVAYIFLRAETMVSWNLSDWKRDVGWQPDNHNGPGITRDGSLPPTIIDTQRDQIFLPVWFPGEIAERIKAREALGRESSGLKDYLQHDPHELIDLLALHAATPYWATIMLFLVAHLMVLAGVAGAVGSRISIHGAIIDLAT